MANSNNYHASYDRDREQWRVARAGSRRASNYVDHANDAWSRTNELAEKSGGEAFKHRKDNGRIHMRNSHGNDPYPPKG